MNHELKNMNQSIVWLTKFDNKSNVQCFREKTRDGNGEKRKRPKDCFNDNQWWTIMQMTRLQIPVVIMKSNTRNHQNKWKGKQMNGKKATQQQPIDKWLVIKSDLSLFFWLTLTVDYLFLIGLIDLDQFRNHLEAVV